MDALPPDDVACVPGRARALALLKPLRAEILRHARTPLSATAIAAALGLPRQKVNYHVRALARAGFLRRAGRRRRRGFVEQRWVATARSYVLVPEAAGPLGPDPDALQDRLGAGGVLALAGRVQREVGAALAHAARERKRVATFSLDSELRFENAAQRAAFAAALRDAVVRAVAEHSSPARRADGTAGVGRPFRLVLACHPIPPAEPPTPETP